MKTISRYSNLKFLIVLMISTTFESFGQSCETAVKLNLVNQRGGIYSHQKIILTSLSDGLKYEGSSDVNGKAEIAVPCNQVFDVNIANYTHKLEIKSATGNGGWISRTVTYGADMAEKDKFFAMNEAEKQQLDELMKMIQDTNKFAGSMMRRPYDLENYSKLVLTLTDLKDGPLVDEKVTLTGENRNKSFQGRTNKDGLILFYLPKGDNYSVNFEYNKKYSSFPVRYDKGNSESNVQLSYMGTKEFQKRKQELEERMRVERERMERERKEFIAWCKAEGITEEEGYVRKLDNSSGNTEKVITAVLDRNKWSEKLIVCDLTGSMLPYAAQLSVWYQLNVKLETNLQFVFFNDGDDTPDELKVIGKTGGIYYQRASGLKNLVELMSKVQTNGGGGDGPENNMEALIEGVKLAGPYKELVMIVDNNASVKDITLLSKFNRPVHVILCGAYSGRILEDYLQIAWKTKGTIHTMEHDLTELAKMAEGETIKVNNITYKIMGGQFVRITEG